MSSSVRAEGFSPELRASLFHFTVFASTGAGSAYMAIWLSGKGLSSGEIGIINALPVLLMLGVNVLVGRLADKASDWRDVIIILALISGVAPIGFFFVNEFWGLLLILTLSTMPSGALVPVIDAATLRMCQRRGTDFGFVRAWGTVGYMVTAAVTGVLIGWLGAIAFVPIFIALSLLRAGLVAAAAAFPRAAGRRRTCPAAQFSDARQPDAALVPVALHRLRADPVDAFLPRRHGRAGVEDRRHFRGLDRAADRHQRGRRGGDDVLLAAHRRAHVGAHHADHRWASWLADAGA